MNKPIKNPRRVGSDTGLNNHVELVNNNTRPVEPLLSRLDSPKETSPQQWLAKCPAHEDKSPSLAIRELPDGRVLLYCFAGCYSADVLASLGLEMRDLFPDERPYHARPVSPAMRWNYRDILRVVGRELTLVQICASDMSRGLAVAEVDRKRLETAAQRIRRAVEAAA